MAMTETDTCQQCGTHLAAGYLCDDCDTAVIVDGQSYPTLKRAFCRACHQYRAPGPARVDGDCPMCGTEYEFVEMEVAQ